MTLPTFLVIGAGRSGTTSLYHYLRRHPGVFMSPVREPSYFSWTPDAEPRRTAAPRYEPSVTSAEAYEALFSGVTTETAIGEVSPRYMLAPAAAERIRRSLPDARLVAVLRHPVERTYSAYLGSHRDGFDTEPTFEAALHASELRERQGSPFQNYIGAGLYHRNLMRFLALFPRSQLRIYLFEDLVADPAAPMCDLLAFLGVEPIFRPELWQHLGRTGEIRNPFLGLLWRRSLRLRQALRPFLPQRLRDRTNALFTRDLLKPEMKPETRAYLLRRYRDDTLRLQELMGRDLSHWLR